MVLIIIGHGLFIRYYEALEGMLFQLFFGEQYCGLPAGLAEICADPDLYRYSTETQYHEFAR